MQINPTDAVLQTAAQTGGAVSARVLAGNLAAVPIGALLQATVMQVNPREATLSVNGQTLTIRPPAGLQPGAVLFVRVPNPTAAANATIELADPRTTARAPEPGGRTAVAVPEQNARNALVATQTQEANKTEVAGTKARPPEAVTTAPVAPPRVARVDVLAVLPDGRVRVNLQGRDTLATTTQPLAAGGRYVLQVERTPAGLTLRLPPDSPTLPRDVATAILRSAPPPDFAATLKPLVAELNTLAAKLPTAPGEAAQPVPVTVRNAAVAVQEVIRSFLPTEARPPDAAQLRHLVENGGLHFEAKLARLVPEGTTPSNALAREVAPPNTAGGTPAPQQGTAEPTAREANARDTSSQLAPQRAAGERAARELAPDLKSDLLRLLQAANDLGRAATVPAARAALEGIEVQQAGQALAQASGTPYLLQVPFPDGREWRTLHLAIDPERRHDQAEGDRTGRFRLFMHVPLTDLGETWIDAGLSGASFRAAIYLDRADVRDRVRGALSELKAELRAEGFDEVLLDVRSSDDLPGALRKQVTAMRSGRPESASVLDVRA